MRCPECTTRNSVAAPKCVQCGARFKRRPIPVALILGLSGVLGLFVLVLGAMAVVPNIMSPEVALQKVAKRVAAGPKTPQDAERLKADLEDAVKRYIERNHQLTAKQIAEKLRANLPSSAYEINSFDLPRGLKLIDVDTVMQPSNYLIAGKSVTVMRGFEVYDSAKAINDPSGPVLAVLGHRTAQAGRQPQLRLYALMGDGVKERPSDSVPKFTGDGAASFAANEKDVDVELSLMSRAIQEGLFTASSLTGLGLNDENLKTKLTFDSGKYTFADVNGRGPVAALRAVAFTVADPREKERFAAYLSPGVQAALPGLGKLRVCPPEFELKRLSGAKTIVKSAPQQPERRSRRSRRHRRSEPQSAPVVVSSGGARYLMANGDDAFEVTLGQADGRYQVVSISRTKTSQSSSTVAVSDPGQPVPYEDKTSTLVDRLLDAPAPVMPDTFKQKPVGYEAPATNGGVKANEPAKVVEKHIAGESATIQASSATVKVRSGPGTNFDSLTEVSRGSNVEVIGKEQGWYKVRVDGKEGFVYGGFVNCKTSDAYASATVNWGRSIKDEHNRTIGHTRQGDKVVVLGGMMNDKYKIQMADGKVGYVDKKSLDIVGTTSSTSSVASSTSGASTYSASSTSSNNSGGGRSSRSRHRVKASNTSNSSDEAPQFVP